MKRRSGRRLSFSRLAGMPRKHRGALWCDGIYPIAHWVKEEPSRIEGEAWIGYASDANLTTTIWRITLFLPATIGSREEIDWGSLLPPENVTCWLAMDEERRALQIEPGAAVPDLRK